MRDLPLGPDSDDRAVGVVARSRRALVFDDQAEIGALAVTRLIQLGFDAKSVTERSAFLAMAESWQPELIVLDLSLGDGDAIELFELLNEQAFSGHVILMSGHSVTVLDHARQLGEDLGMSIAGVLKKPFRQRDLRALVASLGGPSARPRLHRPDNPNPALLREALDKNWLEFWYQPKVDLKTGLIVGAESLARVRHPDQGILAPGAFLQQASEEELYEVTTRALDEAVRCTETMRQRGRPLTFSINVAAKTFKRTDLIEQIRAIRKRHSQIVPITLEVTETDLVDDKFAVKSFATRAILQDFRISIDDFGHGYASFERLRDMPFSELKLERSMVNGCARDPALRSICKAVLGLAHGFGAFAVAEGVENADDLETIRSLGFDMAQGYFFSRPLPFREFEQLQAAFATVTTDEKGGFARG